MKSNFVVMSIELNIECPNEDCPGFFDLFDNESFVDDGFLYDVLMPRDESWGNKNFQQEIEAAGKEIRCPECNTKIEVESVDW